MISEVNLYSRSVVRAPRSEVASSFCLTDNLVATLTHTGETMPSIEQARDWYPENDPVHGFDHVMRVYHTAEHLAAEMGADLEIVRAAALLHDAEGAAPDSPGSGRSTHEQSSAQFARSVLEAEGWGDARIAAVEHCIRAHRYRGAEPPDSLEAKILFDADKIDVLGAFGIARTIAYAVQAGQPVYSPPSERFRREGSREPGEPHSAYHEYLFKLRRVAGRLHTPGAAEIARARVEVLDRFFKALADEAEWKAPGL